MVRVLTSGQDEQLPLNNFRKWLILTWCECSHNTRKCSVQVGVKSRNFFARHCGVCGCQFCRFVPAVGNSPPFWHKPAFSRFSQNCEPLIVVEIFGKIVKRQVCQKRGWVADGWFVRNGDCPKGGLVTDECSIQIKRWRAFTRHYAQVVRNSRVNDGEDGVWSRPKQRQALLQWAYPCFVGWRPPQIESIQHPFRWHDGMCDHQNVNSHLENRSQNSMLPRRRFWTAEQTFRTVFSKHFSHTWVLHLGCWPLKSSLKTRPDFASYATIFCNHLAKLLQKIVASQKTQHITCCYQENQHFTCCYYLLYKR